MHLRVQKQDVIQFKMSNSSVDAGFLQFCIYIYIYTCVYICMHVVIAREG